MVKVLLDDPRMVQVLGPRQTTDENSTSSLIVENNVMPNQEIALHRACLKGTPEVVDMLLQDGRIDPNLIDGRQQTPLGIAVDNCRKDVVEILLQSERVDPNKCSNGEALLDTAKEYGDIKIISLLEAAQKKWRKNTVEPHNRNTDS